MTLGDKRVPVRVIYPDAIRHTSDLQRLPIVLADGRLVYLGDVAEISTGRGMNTISRRDTRRLGLVTAEVDDKVTTPLEVSGLVRAEFADLERELPGYELLFLGEKKDAAESFQGMRDALLISGVLIFFILAALFRSLLDPLVHPHREILFRELPRGPAIDRRTRATASVWWTTPCAISRLPRR